MLLDDLPLPLLEHDRPLVLAPGPVLREQAGPVLPGHRGDDTTRDEPRVGSTSRLHLPHEVGDPAVGLGVGTIVEHVKIEDAAPAPADVSVSEVPAEQLGVRARVERSALASRARGSEVLLTARFAAALVFTTPSSNRLDGHPVELGIECVGHARVRRAQSAGDGLRRSDVGHEINSRAPPPTAVPGVGFEPTSPFGQWCLRPPRMPFRQPGSNRAYATGFWSANTPWAFSTNQVDFRHESDRAKWSGPW